MKWKIKDRYIKWYYRFSLLPKKCSCNTNFWLEKYLVKKEMIIPALTGKKQITRKYFCSDCEFGIKKDKIKKLARKIKEMEEWVTNPFAIQQLSTSNMGSMIYYNPATQTLNIK